eukprot:5169710-Pyramimonas_sp.AAC.1
MLLSAYSYTCFSHCLPCHSLTLRLCAAAVCASRGKRSAPALGRRASSVVGWPASPLTIPEYNCLT